MWLKGQTQWQNHRIGKKHRKTLTATRRQESTTAAGRKTRRFTEFDSDGKVYSWHSAGSVTKIEWHAWLFWAGTIVEAITNGLVLKCLCGQHMFNKNCFSSNHHCTYHWTFHSAGSVTNIEWHAWKSWARTSMTLQLQLTSFVWSKKHRPWPQNTDQNVMKCIDSFSDFHGQIWC